MKRDYTRAPQRVPIRWVPLGQLDAGSATAPLLGIAAGLFALALIGGGLAQRHQRTSLTNNKQRKKRNKTRGGRRAYARARGHDRVEERRFLERLSKALHQVEEMSPEDRYYLGL